MTSEGSRCECSSEIEHARLLARIDESFKQDYDMHSHRRRSAPTSESLKKRRIISLNGHS